MKQLARTRGSAAFQRGGTCYGARLPVVQLVINYERSPHLQEIDRYAYILENIIKSVGLVPISCKSYYDLACGPKMSAITQPNAYLLHHGTLLYDFDLAKSAAICAAAPAGVSGQREHSEFLCNLQFLSRS